MKNNLVEITNLEKTYISKGESLTVLKDLNLEIPEGKKITIVGQSGNGKRGSGNSGSLRDPTKGFEWLCDPGKRKQRKEKKQVNRR